jgi:hypothetical protein
LLYAALPLRCWGVGGRGSSCIERGDHIVDQRNYTNVCDVYARSAFMREAGGRRLRPTPERSAEDRGTGGDRRVQILLQGVIIPARDRVFTGCCNDQRVPRVNIPGFLRPDAFHGVFGLQWR